MATPIGDAVVRVKIDTSQAEAELDRLDGRRQGGSERHRPGGREDRPDGERRPDREPPRIRPRTRPPTKTVRGIKRQGALPIVGGVLAAGVLAAEFGPAVNEFAATIAHRIVDMLPVDPVTKATLDAAIAIQTVAINESAEAIARLETFVTAGFGSLQDTKQIAKAAFLFSGKVDLKALGSFISGRFEMRKAEGMGRWAERQITRRAIGKGAATSLLDSVSTQE